MYAHTTSRNFALGSVVGLLALVFFPLCAGAQCNAMPAFSGRINALLYGRSDLAAARLHDGRIIVVGGAALSYSGAENSKAELYNEATDTWSTLDLPHPVSGASVTVLHDGKVLIAGGVEPAAAPTSVAMIYDPGTGMVSMTGSLHYARWHHSATLLNDGKVLIVGGVDYAWAAIAPAELYDPLTGVFQALGNLSNVDNRHTATLLDNGKVLIVEGGSYLFDPSTRSFIAGPAAAPEYSPVGATATKLLDGRVLIAGGSTATGHGERHAEIYDPISNTRQLLTATLYNRQGHTATLLPDGRVLLAGGNDGDWTVDSSYWAVADSVQYFDPAASPAPSFISGPDLQYQHSNHAALLLDSGRLLVIGGQGWDHYYSNFQPRMRDIEISASFYCGPHIVRLTPASGPSGIEVEIQGTKFGNSPGSVIFNNGVSAAVISWSDSEIHVIVPASAATGPVMVSTADGVSNGVTFTVVATEADLFLTNPSTELGAYPGDPVTYANGIGNNGPNTAMRSHGIFPVPAGLSVISATSSTGSCDAAAGEVNCDFANVLYGGSTNMIVTLNAEVSGTYQLIPSVSSSTFDPNRNNNSVKLTLYVYSEGTDVAEKRVSTTATMLAAGVTFDVFDETMNFGTTGLPATVTCLYLEPQAGGTRVLLAQRNVFSMPTGGLNWRTTTVTVPAGTTPGRYWVRACGDDTNVVTEVNESNNCVNSPTLVQVSAQPDLIITALGDPPSTISWGGQFNISVTVVNQGYGDAVPSTTRFYLVGSAGASYLLGGSIAGPQARNASLSSTAALTVPGNIPVGVYSLRACADDLQTVAELSEANNCWSSQGRSGVTAADLQVTSVVIETPTNLSEVYLHGNLLNGGSGPAMGGFSVNVYLSPTPGKTANSVLIATTEYVGLEFAPGAETHLVVHGQYAQWSTQVAPGQYYAVFCADSLNQVPETDEGNNCASSTATVSVGPDLQMTSLGEPPAAVSIGDRLFLYLGISNFGNTEASPSVARVYLSPVPARYAGSTLLGMAAIPALAVGQHRSASINAAIPAMPAGSYYLVACADDLLQVAEFNEDNNCLTSVAKVQVVLPDLWAGLEIPALQGPPLVTWLYTANAGAAPAPASTTSIYLSPVNVPFNPQFAALVQQIAVPPLAAQSGVFPVRISVSVPSNLAPGWYYVVACADGNGAIQESEEANNCSLNQSPDLQRFKLASNHADLEISRLDLVDPATRQYNPANLRVGQGSYFPVRLVLENLGPSLAGAPRIGIFLSTSSTFSASAVRIGSTVAPNLAGFDFLDTGEFLVQAARPGNFYVIACADPDASIVELDETNNCVAAPVTINIAAPPAPSVTLKTTYSLSRDSSGQVLVAVTLTNTGGSAASNANLTVVKLTTSAATTLPLSPLPVSFGAIASGGAVTRTVVFPASAGAKDTPAILTLGGTYLGGSFNTSGRVVLP